jgi:hypothetical protein
MPLAQPHQILAQKLLFQRWKLPNKVFPPGAVTAKTPLSDEIANITVFISTRRDSTAAPSLLHNSPEQPRWDKTRPVNRYFILPRLQYSQTRVVTLDPHKYDNLSFTRQGISFNKVRFRFTSRKTID